MLKFLHKKVSYAGNFDPDEFDLELRPFVDRKEPDAAETSYTWILSPYCEEHWDDFPVAAVAVANRLFSGLYVITAAHALSIRNGKHMYSWEEMFLQTYFRTLCLYGIRDNIWYQEPGHIITQSQGLDIPLSTLLFSGDYGELFDYIAYGFSESPVVSDFVQAKASVDTMAHMLKVEYERTPDLLYIHVDRQWLSPARCLSAIRSVCKEKEFSLEIRSELFQYVR